MASNSNTNEKAERCPSQIARSILGISWKDRVTNEEVRVRTGQQSMDNNSVKEDSVGLDM